MHPKCGGRKDSWGQIIKLCEALVLSDHAFSFIVLTVRSKVIICHIRDFIGFESVSVGSFICSEKINWLVLSGIEENAKGEGTRSQ